jgi:uncharacterized protein (UPF0212 family)
MKPSLQTDDALELIYRRVRKILRENDIPHGTITVRLVPQSAFGSTIAAVEITSHHALAFLLSVTVFDSDDQLVLRIAREVEGLNVRRRRADRHEFMFCWCGHSGRDWPDELGHHYSNGGVLRCHICGDNPIPDHMKSRPLPLRCPCCVFGHRAFKSKHDRIEYCGICSGFGYLVPSFYE